MHGHAIKITFNNGETGIFERVTMRHGEKVLVIKKFGDINQRVYSSKRDAVNRCRILRRQFSNMAVFEVIYTFGREVLKT